MAGQKNISIYKVPQLEQCGSNAGVITPTPLTTATRAVWQQCLGDYAHPTYYRN